MVDDASMSAPGAEQLVTVHARASYQALARTPPLRIAVAPTTFLPPAGGEVGPEATAEFAVEQSFALWVAAFEGELPRSWAGHEIHSRHQRITTPTADVIADACAHVPVPRQSIGAAQGSNTDQQIALRPLVVQDQLADGVGELLALPAALGPAGGLALARGSGRARGHGVAAGRAGVPHPRLPARPGPDRPDRLPRPRVAGRLVLEPVQDVLGAGRRPQRQEAVVVVGERAPAADGDQPGVALLGEDHRCPSSRSR